jgi:hypothetical protein
MSFWSNLRSSDSSSYAANSLSSATRAGGPHPRRTVGEVRVPAADASSEPGCSRDQKQPCPDDDDADGSRDALTRRCETFNVDGCRHDSHRAKVHDPNDQEDRRQTGTAVAALESEAQAVSPGRAGVGRQRTAAPGSGQGDAPSTR